ncbi:MAG: hypothetical protein ACTHKY_20805 [Ginsengibacter sp.]
MSNKLKNLIIAAFLIIGLSAILKFYFKTPDIGILFLVVLGAISGVTTVLVKGFINPPTWLYRIRFSILGVLYGVFIGILLFGKEAIEENSFSFHDLLVCLVIGAILGVVLHASMMFAQTAKLKRRKGLSGRQLVKDSALLINQNGEKIKGKLVLTNEQLIFLGNETQGKILERDVHEIHPNITKTKFLGIPDGFSIENDEILLKVSFPYYWLKSINKKENKMIA